MAPKIVKAGAMAGTDLRKPDLAINSENSLDKLRAQYLAEIYSLPADTACTIAELAFGEGSGR